MEGKKVWKITPVLTGKFGMVRDDIKFEGGDPAVSGFVPSVLFLLECEDRQVVVDTGFGDAAKCTELLNLDVEREEPYEKILETAGVRSKEITDVIFTHLHWDHAGMACCFPIANFYCQEREWERAQNYPEEYPREWTRYLMENRERVKCVKGEGQILPGIQVRYVGGHTYGSQIVLVNTRNGLEIIAGDVMMTKRNLQENIPVGLCVNREECREGITLLQAYKAENIYPSHDFCIFMR